MRGGRVAAVHDLSGAGRCSLSVVLPVLTAMGACVNPAVTAYLSAHTGYPPSARAVKVDLTAALGDTVEHWAALGMFFDAIYSGYLSAEGQAAAVERLIVKHPSALVFIDPVLGDNGSCYRGISDGLRRAMAGLVEHADVITPNLTECALLLGEPFDETPSQDKLRHWMERLSGGKRSVVVTGVRPAQGRIGCTVFDRADGAVTVHTASAAPRHYPGTGDLFASVLLGGLLRGQALQPAAARAVDFTARCAALSYQTGGCEVEGVLFAPLLGELTAAACETELL